jgi:predicted ABC-type transport system involved in lysophospholipase L1 biosynthesis ATPase subunit
MGAGEAIALMSGIFGLVGTLWKVFFIISSLQRQIEKLEAEGDRQELIINGLRERMEHLNTRYSGGSQKMYDRLNHVEAWLDKHTEYQSTYTR